DEPLLLVVAGVERVAEDVGLEQPGDARHRGPAIGPRLERLPGPGEVGVVCWHSLPPCRYGRANGLPPGWVIRYRVPLKRVSPGWPARMGRVVNGSPCPARVSRSSADGTRSWSVNRHRPPGASSALTRSTSGSTLRAS